MLHGTVLPPGPPRVDDSEESDSEAAGPGVAMDPGCEANELTGCSSELVNFRSDGDLCQSPT